MKTNREGHDQRAVAWLHGLPVGPISLSTTPVPPRNRALVTAYKQLILAHFRRELPHLNRALTRTKAAPITHDGLFLGENVHRGKTTEDARTYAADERDLFRKLKAWAAEDEVRDVLNETVEGAGDRPVFLRAVSRVYLTGGVIVSTHTKALRLRMSGRPFAASTTIVC